MAAWQCSLLVLAFTIMQFWKPSMSSFWPKLINPGNPISPIEGLCVYQNNKLLSLLNLLCNSTQTTSVQMRDACYGCFFRAGSILDAPSQLYSLNDCARLYMLQTNYSSCASELQAVVDGQRPLQEAPPGALCYGGYCEFVRCIKRINTQQLVSACFTESLGTRNLSDSQEQIYFYRNVTACILARTRCSQYNPITGELQRPSIVGAPINVPPPPTFFNALHVGDTGELRILAYPMASAGSLQDWFCAAASLTPLLLQAAYSSASC